MEMSKEIEKQRLINLIIQGEAKNVKRIYAAPEVKEGLVEILGEKKGNEAIEALKQLTNAADDKDWLESLDTFKRFLSDKNVAPVGLVSVEWE
jgi:hypothetical protein